MKKLEEKLEDWKIEANQTINDKYGYHAAMHAERCLSLIEYIKIKENIVQEIIKKLKILEHPELIFVAKDYSVQQLIKDLEND